MTENPNILAVEAAQSACFPVGGMSCAACAARIEKKLGATPGIHAVTVNFGGESAAVRYDPGVIPLRQIAAAVRALGFTVPAETAVFAIGGMSCAACVSRIEKKLSHLDGILRVAVNLAAEKAEVEFIASAVNTAAICQAVEALGFTCSPAAADETRTDANEQRRILETQALRRKLIFSIAAAVLVMALQMRGMLPWLPPGGGAFYTAAVFLLATAAQFWCGWPFYTGAWNSLRHGAADMNTLIATGTTAAWLYSAFATLAPDTADGGIGIYFDTSTMIIALVLLGRHLENLARRRASDAIRKLLDLRPKTARVERDGQEIEVPVAALAPGDIVCVRPGEKIAVDGLIIAGGAAIDESMLTGESLPVDKKAGDQAVGGSFNRSGFFKMRANRLGRDSVLGHIIRLVEEAQNAKAPAQRLADKVAGVFALGVIACAAAAFAFWLFWGARFAHLPLAPFPFALTCFISVLIVACPCALGLATPTAIMAGMGRAAELGFFIKGGETLEKICESRVIVFDKTGTLTRGQPRVLDVLTDPEAGISAETLLTLAASVEKGSEHPVGQAIVAEAAERGLKLKEFSAFKAAPGLGVEALIGGCQTGVGSLKFLEQHGVDAANLRGKAEEIARQGRTPMFLFAGQKAVGIISVADTLKPHAREAIARLRRLGLDVALLTGDNRHTAQAIAAELGIDTVFSEVTPAEKAAVIKSLKASGKKTVMVGDGINDAPALAEADAGIALGAGADVALETADITLASNRLSAVADAIELSGKTMRVIRQNLFWAFFYNILGIPLAAGVFYPLAGILLQPPLAAAAMSASSISVVCNSLLLKRFQPSRH